jgi:hypothetical protein
MMASVEHISLTLFGVLQFLLLHLPPLLLRIPLLQPMILLLPVHMLLATTRRGKKQNILVRGLKKLISMCHSNDTLIRESHQQMSQRLSTLEER